MKPVTVAVLLLCLAVPLLAGEKPLTLLTPDLLAGLPADEQGAWEAYLAASRAAAAKEREVLAAECRGIGREASEPAPDHRAEFEFDSDTPVEWYGRPENVALAAVVMSYQTPAGGWSKAVDYSKGPRPPGTHWTTQSGAGWHYCGTFDNRSTTEQIKFLAGVHAATGDPVVKSALLKGIDYVFAAQYPNGGWPQNYPVERGYHEAITLNDDAMTHVLELLVDLAGGEKNYTFADEALRRRAEEALDRGLSCLAAMQYRVDGKPTVWCAQHHPLTLEPVHARAKEPPSLSGGESATLVKFLMREAPITPGTTAMIEAALAWFEANRLTGLRKGKTDGKTNYLPDPASTEVYWARFYDLKSGKPIFAGADDGIIYGTFSEMAAKNKVAYDFMTTRPGDLLEKETPRWRKRIEKEAER